MEVKVALLFAGQGAQTVGMGQDLPAVRESFARADEVLGRNLSEIAFHGPLEELTRTANCQPALFVHGLGCLEALQKQYPSLRFAAAAGLSLGEFTAHTMAGTFDFSTGLKLVAQRGAFMDEACAATDGAMAAMIGGEREGLSQLAAAADVDIANFNAPGQTVLSGSRAGIALAIERAKEFGVKKAVPLTVAGAYHSRLMASAQEQLAGEMTKIPMQEPKVPVPSNFMIEPARGLDAIRHSLICQVTGSVRWYESIEWMLDHAGITHFIELGPGGVLAGLLGRIRRGVEVLSISDATSLDAAASRLTELSQVSCFAQ